jgi:tetratricopeptide (TPR) repeat protein
MARILSALLALAAIALTLAASAAEAHQGTGSDPLLDMQAMARALGVSCSHCHVDGDFKSDSNPKKGIAREMIAMTRELNARIQSATGKPAAQVKQMHCVNCHRGLAVPRTLIETVAATIVEKGDQAAVEQYRDLRTRFYARDTYDFSEQGFLGFLERLAGARPDSALALAQMNLEFNPKSATTYLVMSRAYTRKRDKAMAIEMVRKALEIEPDNGIAKGMLYQLDPTQR